MSKLLLVLLCSCSLTTRYVTKKCPVPTTAVLMDFVVGMTAIAVGQIKFMADKRADGYGFTVPGIVLVGVAYGTEISCMK